MTTLIEHRSRSDRRNVDKGPPFDTGERRHLADRRLPTIEEFSISQSDWVKLFGPLPGQNPLGDLPSEWFERVDHQSGKKLN